MQSDLERVLFEEATILHRLDEIAAKISADYKSRELTVIAVLNGSLIFLADLIRRLDLPLRVGLIQASSYRGAVTSPGELHVDPVLVPDVQGRLAPRQPHRGDDAGAVAPRDRRAVSPLLRDSDRDRRAAGPDDEPGLAPVAPALARRDDLAEVGRRHGDGPEHEPVAAGAIREPGVIDDLPTRHWARQDAACAAATIEARATNSGESFICLADLYPSYPQRATDPK